jgi:ppGpp synthetase/RelA/SpoT-type nucleotidyltranferase
MKIPKALRDLHASQTEIYALLKKQVDEFMQVHKDQSWHYVSRLKSLESFALKVETGRYSDPSQLDDFFACTLVVDNLGSMAKAEKLVRRRFKFQERRPQVDTLTSKPSDSFRFDDTRLYVRWKDRPISKPAGLDGLLFEVQIKSFLAHAWSIATHDLIYKTDEKSWPRERIAFQIKAMLEHAEISILEAKKLSRCTSLKKTDDISQRISSIIRMVNDLWNPSDLPQDTKRLAENVDNLIQHVRIDLPRLREVLRTETELGRGTKILNLSPYSTIIQSLLNQESSKMINYLTGRSQPFKVYIPRELEMPPSLNLARLPNALIDKNP